MLHLIVSLLDKRRLLINVLLKDHLLDLQLGHLTSCVAGRSELHDFLHLVLGALHEFLVEHFVEHFLTLLFDLHGVDEGSLVDQVDELFELGWGCVDVL